ncbi:MAG: ABC transporter ATP-binding protein [Clostridiales bacterium]|nr:ABC transporter ATP-binding protein [Clostridiales bacterium]
MNYVIEMLHITKQFPGVKANDDVTLQVREGEIHALLGENGAGKSTLMSILFGMYRPDAGSIKLRGREVDIVSPRMANELGIGMVHQHFTLVHNFTVLDNIILGVEDTKFGLLWKEKARQKVLSLSEQYGLKVDPDAIISETTVGMQQRVEILKMLYRNNDILIFDEPTAVLTPQEIDELMDIMKGLAAEGKSIIFITHKLEEIKRVADRCTVLRNGKCIGTVNVDEVTVEEMSEMMVGRKVVLNIEKDECKAGKPILDVRNLSVNAENSDKTIVKNVSFTVNEGEIVCIAGVDGNGQSELVGAITGLLPASSGKIILKDMDITHKTIRYRNTHGLSHIPEDRHKHGLVLQYTLAENLVLQQYFEPKFQKNGFLRFDNIYEYSNKLISEYDIRSGSGPMTTARSMSGGNQQKAIAAREISRSPDLLLAVQPTRGLDVGAIEYMHRQIVKVRDMGKAVLVVSFDLNEVMNLADRILVMFKGEIVADVKPDEVTENELGLYMAGVKRGGAQ